MEVIFKNIRSLIRKYKSNNGKKNIKHQIFIFMKCINFMCCEIDYDKEC